MTQQRRDPPLQGSERELLDAFLDFHRATLLMKIDGLDDEQVRRQMTPSGVTLLGMVKHLAYVERDWFARVFAGQDVDFPWADDDPDADWRIEPSDTTQGIIDLYRREIDRSRALAAGASLEETARRNDQGTISLRWLLIHMIEETARHNGHADLMREAIDGATGE